MSTQQTPAARVTHHFRATSERVFDAWLNPQMIGQFMFGKNLRDEEVVHLAVDARMGGKFSFVVRRNGQEIDHIGEYLEIDRPRRLVFTWGIGPEAPGSRVIIEIATAADGCDVTLTHELAAGWENFVDRAAESWSKMLNALEVQLT